MLFRVHQNTNDYLVEELTTALNDIEVTIGDWIKRAGVDGTSHGPRWYIADCRLPIADWTLAGVTRGTLVSALKSAIGNRQSQIRLDTSRTLMVQLRLDNSRGELRRLAAT